MSRSSGGAAGAPSRLAVRWASPDPAATRTALAAALGAAPEADGPIVLANATIEVVAAGPAVPPLAIGESRVGRTGDRGAPAEAPGPAVAVAGIGWATVDLERAAVAWPERRFLPGLPEASLGARTLVERDPAPGTLAIVLLEPSTEGRLAAMLARHGEGPVVLYVARVGAGPRHLVRLPIVTGPHLSVGEPPGLPSVA